MYWRDKEKKQGWIELITGCMFAGKTEEFIKRIKRYSYSKEKVIAFKPIIDNRYSEEMIASHAGATLPSFPVNSTEELKMVFEREDAIEKVTVVGIDEVQFFDTDIVEYIDTLANNGVIVVVTGLDKDFRCEPFKNVDKLLPMAEFVKKLSAICYSCGGLANRTQRLVNSQPAKASDPLILVSGSSFYEARCRMCYIKPE